MKDVSLSVKLSDGWRATVAQVPEHASPIVLVTLARRNEAPKHVRLDLNKQILIDAPPAEVSKHALSRILEAVNEALKAA